MDEFERDKVRGTRRHWAESRALATLIWAARRLPYDRRVPAFGAFARKSIGMVSAYRERMLLNLDYVWPEMPESRREDIARSAADNFGRTLIEHFSLGELKQRLSRSPLTGNGLSALEDAHSCGQPVILLSGHFGNYEAAWLGIQRLGLSVSGLYRPFSNPYVNRTYVAAMESAAGVPFFPQDRRGISGLLQHLRNGGAATFLSDLYAGNGIEMEFLGRPAMTGQTAAEFALRTEALLVPFYGVRTSDGLDFRIEIETPIPRSDPETMMMCFNHSLERRIIEHPGQWFWMHRRWKRKWNRGKGMVENLHPAAYPRRKSK